MEGQMETTMETNYVDPMAKPYDPFMCQLCNLHCDNEIGLGRHKKTQLHSQREQDEREGRFEVNEDGSIKRPTELYYCDICDVTATCARNLKVHKEGARHQKNLRNRNRGGYEFTEPISYQKRKQTKVTVPPGGRLPRTQAAIDNITEPVIGLTSVVEFQRTGEPCRYVCNLCECKADSATILTHIVGLKHRTNYMKEHHSEQYNEMRQKALKKSDQSVILEEFARTIEAEQKRGKVRVKIELNPFAEEDMQRGMKRPMGADMGPAPKRFDYVPGGRGRGGPAGRGGFGGHSEGFGSYGSMGPPDTATNLRGILSALTTCQIKNEEEASLALQVSNALTQALLNFRLAKKEPPAPTVSVNRGRGRGRGMMWPQAAPAPMYEPYVEDDGYGMGTEEGYGMDASNMDSCRGNYGSLGNGGNADYGNYDRFTTASSGFRNASY